MYSIALTLEVVRDTTLRTRYLISQVSACKPYAKRRLLRSKHRAESAFTYKRVLLKTLLRYSIQYMYTCTIYMYICIHINVNCSPTETYRTAYLQKSELICSAFAPHRTDRQTRLILGYQLENQPLVPSQNALRGYVISS